VLMVAFTNEFFDELRQIGDIKTDTMVDRLIQNGQVANVNEILKLITHNNDFIPAALPDDLQLWFRETAMIPIWVEPERLQRAREFFDTNGLVISLILSTAALVDCFAGKKGVKVLVRTGILQRKTYIRLIETAQFVFNLMEPDGLEPTGKGIVAVQKVRLMHTATRRLIIADQNHLWDQDQWGLPVNQEDLLGTLMSFTILVFNCMEKLNMKFTTEEAEDYYYVWRMIAEMLGIRADLIPANVAEARKMMAFISARQFGSSEEGKAMTKALLDMFERVIPGHYAEGNLHELIRYLVGDEVADWMDIPRQNNNSMLERVSNLKMFKAVEHFFLSESYLNKLSVDLIMHGIHFDLKGEPLFTIPDHLRNSWSRYDDSAEAEAGAAGEQPPF
jgi:hypothetical protein